ncbi:MAG: SPFH domain-containing protein [Fimbriimonadales bacterium]|nr:SPFH domain-containing protein [Fimbriimonadales bacterium]
MSQERTIKVQNGWAMLVLTLLLWIGFGFIIYLAAQPEAKPNPAPYIWALAIDGLLATLLSVGFFIVEPNGSTVLLLFGNYVGTVKQSGFHWGNPFFSKRKVSLRARSLNGEKLKVNDSAGNPVEIAAIVVWRVTDTYAASFQVDDYESYVALQSETAVRHLASSFPYDGEEHEVSLRRNTDEVSTHLQQELQERLQLAGVEVIEARLSHLAYAPEIAGAMLRRQQAAAVVAARQKIVDGAVGMVEMALERLEEHGKVQLDEERKAAMVTNLMVVLCSEQSAQPVVNAGTLYH